MTDETYATGMFYNGNFVFNVVDEYGESENGNLEGLLYYAGEYLKTASKNNFDQTEKFRNIVIPGLYSDTDDEVLLNEDIHEITDQDLVKQYTTNLLQQNTEK